MAWVELYIFFAYIFRKLEMELEETRYVTFDTLLTPSLNSTTPRVSVDDFSDFKDYFIPVYKGSHLHVRAKLVE